jgi:hypothetical protein
MLQKKIYKKCENDERLGRGINVFMQELMMWLLMFLHVTSFDGAAAWREARAAYSGSGCVMTEATGMGA